MGKLKVGSITAAEAAIIKSNLQTSSIAELAVTLNRSQALLEKWIRNNLPKSAQPTMVSSGKTDIKKNLEKSIKWQYMREELTSTEVEYFREQYSNYIQQFREDVLPSEEDQIFNVIKLDIAVHRNRADVCIVRESIQQLQQEYRGLGPRMDWEAEDRQRSMEIEQQLGNLRAVETARNSEYLKMSSELKSLLSELKATRAQRVNKPDSNKESIIDIIKKLQDPDYCSSMGTAAEFARYATAMETQRLSAWHKYENGVLDQPILTSETALPEDGGK